MENAGISEEDDDIDNQNSNTSIDHSHLARNCSINVITSAVKASVNSLTFLAHMSHSPTYFDSPNLIFMYLITGNVCFRPSPAGVTLLADNAGLLLASTFNPQNPTKILIHGFGGGINSGVITDNRNGELYFTSVYPIYY